MMKKYLALGTLFVAILLINLVSAVPTISVTTPNGLINYSKYYGNLNLNATATDTIMDKCWYNYNFTNSTPINCTPSSYSNTSEFTGGGNPTYVFISNHSLNGVLDTITYYLKADSDPSPSNVAGKYIVYYSNGTSLEFENTTSSTSYIYITINNPHKNVRVNNVSLWLRGSPASSLSTIINQTITPDNYFFDLINSTNQKNLTFYANNSSGDLASSYVTWENKVFENSRTYNTSTFETKLENFIINVTSNSSLTNVFLVYNGTTYSSTKSTSGSNYIYTTSLNVPEGNGANTFYWIFNYNSENFTSDSSSQTVNSLLFINCNSTYSTKFINFTFKDESSLSTINATIPSGIFYYYLDNGTVNKTLSYSNTSENYSFAFCSNAVNDTIYISPRVQYVSTGYPQRTYQPSILTLTNSTTNQTLYLLATASGLYVTLQVINSADQIISGVNVNVTREISGTDVIVGQGTTDDAGSVTFWLNPDYEHTFSFYKSGLNPYITSFYPTQSSYTITLSGSSVSQNDTFKGIAYSIVPKGNYLVNDTIYTFRFNLTSSFWDVSDYGFNLRLSNGTIIVGGNTGIEGTELTFNYNVTNQSIIYMDYYWVINGNYTNATRFWSVQNSLYTDYSIANFFTNINTYLDSNLFGLDNFGKYLIVFLIIFTSVGIMSYKYGFTSPISINTLIFGLIFFFDVVVGLIPSIRGIEHVPTYLSGLILILTVFREVE